MRYNGRTFLSTLTFAALQPFSLAGWIPSRQLGTTQQDDGLQSQVRMPDLGDLAKYVCPNTNIFGRQTSTPPLGDQMNAILDMLHAYEQSTADLVQGIAVANGLSSASAVSVPKPTSPPPVMEIFTPVNHPTCIASTITSTLTSTSTTTQTPAPITTTETITVSAAAQPIQPTTTLAQIPNALTSAAQSNQQAAATSTLPAITPISSAAATYQFNATSSTNIAVYFGQTAATGATSLEAQCADPNTDIVILAFVLQQLDGGPYPQLNFGAACGGQTPTMAAKGPGLLYCPELAANITACQRGYGKKVLLSIGGASSNIKFTSASQAKKFAGVLWDLFGPPGSIDPQLRPFGQVEVDGFDIGLSLHPFPKTPSLTKKQQTTKTTSRKTSQG